MPHATAATPPSGHPPRWWTELPLIAVVYGLYSMGRLLVHENIPAAVDNGLAILRLEKALHLNAEHPLNRLLTANPALGIPADFAYASLHYLVTPAVLVWIFRRRSAAYRAARTWLMTSTLLGLVGFTLMPTCPPRLLDAHHGFVDTMAQYSSYGWWGAGASAPRGLSGMTNQYAAMPSLHVGWAVWCGVLLWRHGRHPLVRAAGVAYPLLTVLVVMGTANHYFLDAVAGAAVMTVGALLTRPFMRIADRVKDRVRTAFVRVPATVTPANSTIVSAGCKTSAGERIPGQRTASADSSDARTLSPAEADDDAPAAAR
ncbi:phosphatase PAP2 family protein [[Kitasatospora] papulosa]|uniref:phosphatase PAP2 family protein n=1 Tax=Streptomyces TaxID=1883 RepID=UPI00224C9DC0|nr:MULTISPECIES: phosphatase PAP2 family protein [Streptomyces]MCX4415758.1 phosphatase PAP2 family protein [[Kitasatospora] papulosa]MCY1651694.1 phosphatase PAP2 family protein [Streptomyces sp. SL203]MCY1681121.1 phosphatase PAP2 family protein [Streptomyces sp. SL294]